MILFAMWRLVSPVFTLEMQIPLDANTRDANMRHYGTQTTTTRFVYRRIHAHQRVLSSLRITLFKQASRCTFPNFIIDRRGYRRACLRIRYIGLRAPLSTLLSRLSLSLVSMLTPYFGVRSTMQENEGRNRGVVKKEKITLSNRSSPRPCCFAIVHTIYIIQANNVCLRQRNDPFEESVVTPTFSYAHFLLS